MRPSLCRLKWAKHRRSQALARQILRERQPLAPEWADRLLHLQERRAWTRWRPTKTRPDGLAKHFKFETFQQAFSFMARVADYAEALNHHPEWKNVRVPLQRSARLGSGCILQVYNTVDVELVTHSKSAVTSKDVRLAELIDLCARWPDATTPEDAPALKTDFARAALVEPVLVQAENAEDVPATQPEP